MALIRWWQWNIFLKKEKQFFKCVYGIDSKHLFALELEMKIESLVTFNDKAQISIRNK